MQVGEQRITSGIIMNVQQNLTFVKGIYNRHYTVSIMTSHNDTCPICNSDEARYGSGYITCKWKDRDDNLYFNGNVCDNCWDKIVIPLLSGKIKNNIKVVDTIKYMIDINRNPLT